MLMHQLIHPQILAALAAAGHGSQVLVADGNYPVSTQSGHRAALVHLNLSPGVVGVPEVVQALVTAVPLEAAAVMVPDDGEPPPVHAEVEALLPEGLALRPLDRFAFYEACRGEDLALVVATAEQRVYANVLLTIGVRTADADGAVDGGAS